MFGALLVASNERMHNPEQWSSVELYRPYLDLAAEALRRLDSGNRVIERCAEYLSQLSMILKATSEFFWSLLPSMLTSMLIRKSQH